MNQIDLADELSAFCAERCARYDGVVTLQWGVRHEVVDGQGRQLSVDYYPTRGTVYLEDRGIETDFSRDLRDHCGKWQAALAPPRKPTPPQCAIRLSGALLDRATRRLKDTHGGSELSDGRWKGANWIATYYCETSKLLIQGKGAQVVIEDLVSLLDE